MTNKTVLCVLGSTGSIGTSTLDVVARHPDRFSVHALTASTQVELMARQCLEFRPTLAVMGTADHAQALREQIRGELPGTEVLYGPQALCDVAAAGEVDAVMAAIVGAAGLPPALAAARAGKRLLLANKEAVVCAGRLLIDAVRAGGGQLLPVDSEHSAIHQCLAGAQVAGRDVRRLILTASGGPFRGRTDFSGITPAQAVAHPNWTMGRKISVDSATMMNKGLELIEACWLFATRPERVEVVVHPQSVVHSLVQYVDGSVLAQLGNPDMRTPIAHALAWPERMDSGVRGLDLFAIARLDFERASPERFPCLRLAYQAAETGGTAPVTLNAANEVAVAAFLDRRIGFNDIAAVVARTLDALPAEPVAGLEVEDLLEVDARARRIAEQGLGQRTLGA